MYSSMTSMSSWLWRSQRCYRHRRPSRRRSLLLLSSSSREFSDLLLGLPLGCLLARFALACRNSTDFDFLLVEVVLLDNEIQKKRRRS